MLGSTLYARSRSKWGRNKKKSLAKIYRKVEANEESVIYRWQQVSRFGLGCGAQGLYTWQDATNQKQSINIFDLTSYDGNATTQDPLFGGMYNVNNTLATGHLIFSGPMPHQDAAGSPVAFGVGGSHVEEGEPVFQIDNGTLKWVDLKMNIYGSFSVPVKWRISLVRFHDEVSVPGLSPTANRAISQFESMHRPLKYSNLLTNLASQAKSYRVVKSWNYTIQPLNKTEVWNVNLEGGNEIPSPHFIELKHFIKLDQYCDYSWKDDPTLINVVGDVPSTDTFQTAPANKHSSVYPTNRLFLIIQCSSPQVDTVTNPDSAPMTMALQNWAGSYDICLRRKFKVPIV